MRPVVRARREAGLRRHGDHGLDRPGQPEPRRPQRALAAARPARRRHPRADAAADPAGVGHRPLAQLERSCEVAQAVGAGTVVVHPPFRWQREYARAFVDGVRELEERTGVDLAVENMYPWRARGREILAYLPGWDPTEHDYRHVTLDLSHAATAGSDLLDMADTLGDRLRHVHLTDGNGSAKDEHLVPGRGRMPAAEPARAAGGAAVGGRGGRRDHHPPGPQRAGARGRPGRVAGVRPAQPGGGRGAVAAVGCPHAPPDPAAPVQEHQGALARRDRAGLARRRAPVRARRRHARRRARRRRPRRQPPVRHDRLPRRGHHRHGAGAGHPRRLPGAAAAACATPGSPRAAGPRCRSSCRRSASPSAPTATRSRSSTPGTSARRRTRPAPP
nr:sugar phosphate isomerase/epimerase [Angustibacter aerolatus]